MSTTTALACACPSCGRDERETFFEFGRQPVFANVLYPDRQSARAAPTAPIRLARCLHCDHIGNLDFDPGLVEYATNYENALHFSPRFAAYAEALAAYLVEKHGLVGRDIVEIGCGDGHFLSLLCSLGENCGTGYDPSFDPAKAARASRGRMTIEKRLFPTRPGSLAADLVCCRHALEHLTRPFDFLRTLRRAIGDEREVALYFEVPNALAMLEQDWLWDVVYEHPSFFIPLTLSSLFRRAGFTPTAMTTGFEGQFLSIEAVSKTPVAPEPAPDPTLGSLLLSFGRRQRAKLSNWRERIAALAAERTRIVVWGAGSKGVTFLNALPAGLGTIGHIVDVNPRKQGKFVAGTGQEVVAPARLREIRPETIVLMNAAYRSEVSKMAAELHLQAEILLA